MIGFQPPAMVTIPLLQVAGRTNVISPDAHESATARNLGISIGN